jgi:hypothetical protein
VPFTNAKKKPFLAINMSGNGFNQTATDGFVLPVLPAMSCHTAVLRTDVYGHYFGRTFQKYIGF